MLNQIIINPFINVLIVLYSVIPGHDFGIAVILFTVLIKVLLWPLASKALHSQKAIQGIQPEMNALKKKYGKNKTELNKAVTELYKEKEINPLGSCLPTLIQFPFLIGMFYAFIKFKDASFINVTDPNSGINIVLYEAVKNLSSVKSVISSGSIHTTFIGLVDLARPSYVLAALAAISQYVQTKMMTPKKNKDQTQKMMGQMNYILPLLTFFFATRFPAALPLYWVTQSAVAIFQQYYVMDREVNFLEHLKRKVKKDKS